MIRLELKILLSILLPLFLLTPVSAETYKNHFASILVDGKKIGQVHYMEVRNDEGVLQELKTRASLSIFKIEVYHHNLHTHEFWESGEMDHLWGTANENGKTYEIDLRRQTDGYSGILNKQDIQLPNNSFPTAVWHYAITEHTILFSIPELNLLNVKIKKSTDTMSIELIRNPDIVATISAMRLRPFTVGFAAETRDVINYAKGKLATKNLDMIVATDVANSDIGFNSSDNEVTVIWANGEKQYPKVSKDQLARQLIALIAARMP